MISIGIRIRRRITSKAANNPLTVYYSFKVANVVFKNNRSAVQFQHSFGVESLVFDVALSELTMSYNYDVAEV